VNILLIGSYPPPIGGNSVHIARLYRKLKRLGHQTEVLDYLGCYTDNKPKDVIFLPKGILKKLFFLIRCRVKLPASSLVHLHVSAFGRFKWLGPILVALFFGKKRIITIHSGSFVTQTNKPIVRFHVMLLVSCFHRIITVNSEQANYLAQLGVASSKISLIPAFLSEDPDPKLLPKQLKFRDSGIIKVCTSGYLTPLYNYEVLIDCISNLDCKRYFFVFVFYNEYDSAYEAKIEGLLSKFSNVVCFRDYPPQTFLSILNCCDAYVRTTLADGDSVAVREALSFGKHVFATDCVERPMGSHVFPTKHSESLLRYLQHVEIIKASKPHLSSDNLEKILDLYKDCLRS